MIKKIFKLLIVGANSFGFAMLITNFVHEKNWQELTYLILF